METSRLPPRGVFLDLLARKTTIRQPPAVHVTAAIDSLLGVLPREDQSGHVQNTSVRSQLDIKMDELAAVLRSLHTEVQNRSAALAKQWNSLAPINQLPLELLAQIIRTSMEPVEIGRVRELSAVCKHWWDMLTADSSLWTEVELGEPRIDLILQRSKCRPLNIRACAPGHGPEIFSWSEFGEAIVPHVHRWRSLECDEGAKEWIGPVLSSATLPLLETMTLHSFASDAIEQIDAPKLHEMELYNTTIRWEAARLPNLSDLSLASLDHDTLPPITDLANILTLFPLLTNFNLHRISYSQHRVPLEPPLVTERQSLPNLESMWLTEVEAPVVLHFLDLISANNLKELVIGADLEYFFNGEEAIEGLSQSDPSESCILTAIRNGNGEPIEVRFCETSARVAWGSDSLLEFPGCDLFNMVEDVVSAVHLDHVAAPVHLRLTSPPGEEPEYNDTDPAFLDRLPTLVKLEDSYGGDHLKKIFKHLATLRTDGTWPCPLLEDIWLTAHFKSADNTRDEIALDFMELMVLIREFAVCRPEVLVRDHNQTVFREGLEIFMSEDVQLT